MTDFEICSEELTKAKDSLAFADRDLLQSLHKASRLESLLILQILQKVRDASALINELIAAREP